MMTSSRPRDAGESFASRRGHGNQLSISDPSHHVTEAIGTLYDDSDDDSTSLEPVRRDARPLSFITAPFGGEQIQRFQRPPALSQSPPHTPASPLDHRGLQDELRGGQYGSSPPPSAAANIATTAGNLPIRTSSQAGTVPVSYDSTLLPPLQPMSPLSPTLSLRDVQSADPKSVSQFPLTNIDNPNDIAQELSNLQALRRMSMDVSNTADPDLMPFQGLSLMAMPSIAPSGEDDEGDLSRLLWVPAKVHPELAPEQFKNFLENRVQSIKRRSGESSLCVDGVSRSNSDGLRRKKSMLSRQLDSPALEAGFAGNDDTRDADSAAGATELSLNELVKDPTKVVQRLTQDTQRQSDGGLEKSSLDDDKPILPVPYMGLRRSTRTTYRKGGSVRSGERLPFSKRVAARQAEKDGERDTTDELPRSSLSSELDAPQGESLSVPPRTVRGQTSLLQHDTTVRTATEVSGGTSLGDDTTRQSTPSSTTRSGTSSVTSTSTNAAHPISASVEASSPHQDSAPALATGTLLSHSQSPRPFPQRSSSQNTSLPNLAQSKPQNPSDDHQQSMAAESTRSSKRPPFGWSGQQQQQQQQQQPAAADAASGNPKTTHTLNGMAPHPSALPGSVYTRTDSLTFIPTLSATDDRRSDKKSRDKDDGEGSKSMGWKWFKSEERDKKKKEKEKEKDEQTKKTRARNLADRTQLDKGHDGARLDVLQSSIDNASPKGRESISIERESIDTRLHEERKKETSRRSGETKKEKDGFFFGSIFGGSRRKEGKDAGGGSGSGSAGSGTGKGKQRATSPEIPAIALRPDVDYSYTRFPIVEERAIYRMAHIKLANPRRDLRSQVLLSNFMYSYLAKVQAMHPQLNVPTSPQQKRQEEERKRREQDLQQQQYLEQQMLLQQQQSQSAMDQYNFEYHRAGSEYGDLNQHQSDAGGVDYIDDAQIFDYDHGTHQRHNNDAKTPHGSQHQEHDDRYGGGDHSSNHRGYYDYGHADDDQHGDDDMW